MPFDQMLNQLSAKVDRARLEEHLVAFSKWRKEAGTEGEAASIGYVRSEMEALGYDTELIWHDAYISLPGKASIEVAGEIVPCITHSFSQPTSGGGMRGKAVIAGTGSAADLDGTDMTGRILIVDGIATAPVAMRAGAAGAVGHIHVSPHEHVHEMCISPVWGSPSLDTRDELPRTVAVSVSQEVGERLKQICARDAEAEFVLHAEVDTDWRKTPILVADLTGPNGKEDPFILFSGHHDTWHFGVMDNGGANATMIEVARLCSLVRDRWQRGLRVIFWSGHSQGRYSSSAWYADNNFGELYARAAAHVNIDSTGAAGNVVLHDAQADPELGALAAEAIHRFGNQEFGGFPVARAGDQSFWGIGVPSIFAALGEQPASSAPVAASFLFGGPGRKGAGTGWWWHTPDDTLDKMDPDIAVRDTRIYLCAVWELLARPVLPIDHAASAAALVARLEQAQNALGERFPLEPLLHAAHKLLEDLQSLNRYRDRLGTEDRIAARLNQCILDLSHALVPLYHTVASRFEHDAALSLPPFSALNDLDRLGATQPGSSEEKFVRVSARRALNRAGVALREAQHAVSACHADLSGLWTTNEPGVGA